MGRREGYSDACTVGPHCTLLNIFTDGAMVSERDESLLSYRLVEHMLLENVTLERPD